MLFTKRRVFKIIFSQQDNFVSGVSVKCAAVHNEKCLQNTNQSLELRRSLAILRASGGLANGSRCCLKQEEDGFAILSPADSIGVVG